MNWMSSLIQLGGCRVGHCQCPKDCQSIILGVEQRPVCFSVYNQPLITCNNQTNLHGVCISLVNEILPRCTNLPKSLLPESDAKEGWKTVLSIRCGYYYEARFTDPEGQPFQGYANTFCEKGFEARCMQKRDIPE